MRFNVNHFIQKHPTVISKIMSAEVDTNSSEAGVQKPGADVAFAILGEVIKNGAGYEKYGLKPTDITESLKKDYDSVVAG